MPLQVGNQHEPAEAIIGLETVHPRARDCWLDSWMRMSFGHYFTDQDLAVRFPRKVLPPSFWVRHTLPFRGQAKGNRIGLSRTGSPHIALKFALHGVEDVDPLGVALGEVKESDGVILRSIVPAANIIGTADMEFIIDPRGVEFSTEPSQIGASRASYYSMLTYVVPVDIPTRMDAVSNLSSMLWPGWLLLSAPKWRIGFQRLHGLSRTPVHRRWRTIVPSSTFPAAAVAGATTKRSISDCWPLADGGRLSGLLGQRSHESGPGMGIRAGAHGPGGGAVERRRDRRAPAGNAARRTRLYSQVFECQSANGILRHQARSSSTAFLPTSTV